MEKEQKVKAKSVNKRDKFAATALKHYNELLESKIDFDKQFKPLKQFLIRMGKLPKPDKKKKV